MLNKDFFGWMDVRNNKIKLQTQSLEATHTSAFPPLFPLLLSLLSHSGVNVADCHQLWEDLQRVKLLLAPYSHTCFSFTCHSSMIRRLSVHPIDISFSELCKYYFSTVVLWLTTYPNIFFSSCLSLPFDVSVRPVNGFLLMWVFYLGSCLPPANLLTNRTFKDFSFLLHSCKPGE